MTLEEEPLASLCYASPNAVTPYSIDLFVPRASSNGSSLKILGKGE